MDKTMVLILAGMFARSNMGLPRADIDDVARAKKNPPRTARESSEMFCQQFMESDEHEDMFAGEAEMWEKELTQMSEEASRRTWPDQFKLYDDA